MSKTVVLVLLAALAVRTAHPPQVAHSATLEQAAQKSSAPAAPVPPQTGAAKNVFVTNAGWDCVDDIFRGAPNRAYGDFYLALKRWGRYELLTAADHADLSFGIGFAHPVGTVRVTSGDGGSQDSPKLILRISQPKGNATIWRIAQPVKPTRSAWRRLNKYRAEDLTENIATLVEQLKSLAAQSSTPVATSAPAP